MARFILYGTTACHLCEEAEAMLAWAAAASGQSVPYRKVDISDSDELFERYGECIPVLRSDDDAGRELNWPFDPDVLLRFLAGT